MRQSFDENQETAKQYSQLVEELLSFAAELKSKGQVWEI